MDWRSSHRSAMHLWGLPSVWRPPTMTTMAIWTFTSADILSPRGGEGAPLPYHDANNGFKNRLLQNNGSLQFEDVTDDVGLDTNNRRYTLSAAWDDFDNDGDQDLYVANDFGRNNLFRNDNGRFVDIAAIAGVEDISAGMSVTWGDYNSDGQMDIYVSNMFSSAGNRVTYQRQFRVADDKATLADFQRHRTWKHPVSERRRWHVQRRQRAGRRHHGTLGLGISLRRPQQRWLARSLGRPTDCATNEDTDDL